MGQGVTHCELCGTGLEPVRGVEVRGVDLELCGTCEDAVVLTTLRARQANRVRAMHWLGGGCTAFVLAAFGIMFGCGEGIGYCISVGLSVGGAMALNWRQLIKDERRKIAEENGGLLKLSTEPVTIQISGPPVVRQPEDYSRSIPGIQEYMKNHRFYMGAVSRITAHESASKVYRKMLRSGTANRYAAATAYQVAMGWKTAEEAHPYDDQGKYIEPRPVPTTLCMDAIHGNRKYMMSDLVRAMKQTGLMSRPLPEPDPSLLETIEK